MSTPPLKHILESALLAAGRGLTLPQIETLFEEDEQPPGRSAIRDALAELHADCEDRGVELVETAGGYRLQSRASVAPWLMRLQEERPPRYSRALLETLVLIAYRQPITRGEIEAVRGVSVSAGIIRTLLERDWIREVGHKEVPGRPALFGTTRQFLEYFNLKRLDDLPPLSELKDLDAIDGVLAERHGIVTDAMRERAANDEASADRSASGTVSKPQEADTAGESRDESPLGEDDAGDIDEPEERVHAVDADAGSDGFAIGPSPGADPDAVADMRQVSASDPASAERGDGAAAGVSAGADHDGTPTDAPTNAPASAAHPEPPRAGDGLAGLLERFSPVRESAAEADAAATEDGTGAAPAAADAVAPRSLHSLVERFTRASGTTPEDATASSASGSGGGRTEHYGSAAADDMPRDGGSVDVGREEGATGPPEDDDDTGQASHTETGEPSVPT